MDTPPFTLEDLNTIIVKMCVTIIDQLAPSWMGSSLLQHYPSNKEMFLSKLTEWGETIAPADEPDMSWVVNFSKQVYEAGFHDLFVKLLAFQEFEMDQLSCLTGLTYFAFALADVYSDPYVNPVIQERNEFVKEEFIRILESLVE